MANSSWFSTSNEYIKYRIEVTQNSQSITNNTSNVTVKVWIYRTNTGYTTYGSGTCYCKINGTTHSASITSSQKITNSGIYLFSKTLDIGHNSDGSKNLYCSAWIKHDRVTADEHGFTTTLTTIPRKSTISSITGGTINSNMTVNINRASSSFTTSVWVRLGNSGWQKVANQSSSTSISFTVPSVLANQIPNANKGTGQVLIRTFNGNTELGDNMWDKEFSVPNYSPSIDTFSVSETGSGLGIYVQGKSKMKYSCSASTSYGASISSYTWKFGSATLSSASGTTGKWNSSGTVNISLTVKDSRGKTATKSTSVTYIPYSAPVAKISAYRCNANGNTDNNGDKVRATITGTVSSVNGKNTIAIEVRAKDKSTGSWGEPRTYNTNQTNTVLTLNNYSTEKAYTLQIKVTDKWTTSIAIVEIPTSFVLLDFKGGGKSLAIGKVAESDEWIEIAKPVKFYDRYEPKTFVTSSSADSNGDGSYMTKFARVDLSTGQNYSLCTGFLSICSAESNRINGHLKYFFRRNGEGGMSDIAVYWMTGDGNLMRDDIIVVKVDTLIFDLYWRPRANWTTIRGFMLEGIGQGYMTFYDKQPFVATSSQTAYTYSTFATWGSRNASGHWWNDGVVLVGTNGVSEIGKYLDFHESNTETKDYTIRLIALGNSMYCESNIYPNGNNKYQLGSTSNRWSWINLVNSPNVSSDRTMKENIQYLRNNTLSNDDTMTYSDMYNFVRDDLELAKYNFKGQDEEEINFIAQDLLYNLDGTNNKVGQFIVNPVAPNTEEEIEAIKKNLEEGQEYHDPTLSYDMGNYVSVLAGALKSAINEIEILKQEVISLKQIIDMNKY